MEEKPDKQVSPEEKLLKVIQKSGVPDAKKAVAGGSAATAASPAPTATAAPHSEPPKGKLGLKLAKGQKAAESQPAGKPASPPPKMEKKPRQAKSAAPLHASGLRFSLPLVSRLLGAVAAVLFLLAVWQIVAAFQNAGAAEQRATVGPPEEVAVPVAQEGSEVPPVLVERGIFGKAPDSGDDKTDPKPEGGDWEPYARDHLKLMGFSGAEAILFDKKANKMIVLQVGQKITLGEREVFLDEIGEDQVILSDGRRKFIRK